jgi:tripartite-type tricarboxylate transporter receptor subunit TctC
MDKSILVAAAALLFATAGAAQYPARPVRIVVPYAAGGAAPDVVARVLAEQLSPAFGQPVIVENKPGSNGNIAAEYVARSAPDGYTLLLGHDGLFVINPHLYARMPVDVQRELAPVAALMRSTFVLAVNPGLAANSLPEFIELARRAQPPLAYASAGNGSQHHLMMERLRKLAGIELVHIPYQRGTAAAVASGEVAAAFAGASAAPLIAAGRLRAIAVTSATRSPIYPGVPALAEFYPGFEMTAWLGLFAPAQTPPAIVRQIAEEVGKRFLAAPEVLRRLRDGTGLEPLAWTADEFREVIRRDSDSYGELVRQVGLKIQ